MGAIRRALQIGDGLAKLADKKLRAAVSELKREKVITQSEATKILSGMSKARKNIYDVAAKEVKKVLDQARKSTSKKKSKKKRI